jgi:hypothetical protein
LVDRSVLCRASLSSITKSSFGFFTVMNFLLTSVCCSPVERLLFSENLKLASQVRAYAPKSKSSA